MDLSNRFKKSTVEIAQTVEMTCLRKRQGWVSVWEDFISRVYEDGQRKRELLGQDLSEVGMRLTSLLLMACKLRISSSLVLFHPAFLFETDNPLLA